MARVPAPLHLLPRRHHVRRGLEVLGAPLLAASLWYAKRYRRSFHETSPVLHRVADRLGVYPLIDHYHEPPVRPPLEPGRPRSLPAIDLAEDAQLALLDVIDYADELRGIPWHADDDVTPYYGNPAFPPGDAETLHNVIRHFRPSRVLEVGSGQSTKFIANALRLNGSGELVCVEPYEHPRLERLGFEVVRSPVEELPPSFFSSLGESDVLFIDSSHVVRPQGDVVYLFTEVLPLLAPGVLVHVHDVFTPRDYPREWLARRWFWNEQYVLEALLAGNERLRVLLAVNFLHHEHPPELHRTCPALACGRDLREPSSFWLRVV